MDLCGGLERDSASADTVGRPVPHVSLHRGEVIPGAQAGLEEQWRAAAAQLALGDDGDPVTQEIGLVHIVSGQDDGAI